ncbi:MAG TPA: hypothetical protein VFB62_23070 [Polyangiaceae bacterium]|nr:hypothetical protein [Polyangiaceae bacterium]
MIAVFMSVFLVGGIWYLMGIGDAIVYREKLQAGADATAFTSAVYHARGMNIIAMVNIVIGAVLAITAAAAYLAQIAALLVSVATTMCELSQIPPVEVTAPGGKSDAIDYSVFAFACDAVEPAKEMMLKLQIVIAGIRGDHDSLLVSLSVSQKEVARTAPWVGSAQSAAMAETLGPTVVEGGSGSPAMVPMGDRYGLPVQDEPFGSACVRGTIAINKLARALVPAVFDPLLDFLNIQMAGELPELICHGNRHGYVVWEFFNQDNVCEHWWDSQHLQDKCEEDLADHEKPVQTVDLLGGVDPRDKSTKRIYREAKNGNDYFQVYTVVRGAMARLQRSDVAVEAPSWGRAKVQGPGGTFEGIAVAQAEYFYDQTQHTAAADGCWHPCPAGLSWNSYKENALWNLRWRARLRRYRNPTDVEVNVLTSPVHELVDVSYDSGLATFNGAVGMGPLLLEDLHHAFGSDAAQFIGKGPAVIH